MTSAGEYRADWCGLVTFQFGPESPEVTALAGDTVDEGFIREVFERELTPLIVQLRGREVLHASAVSTRQGVLAFCGESRAGKSTMSHVFGLRGYPVIADDALAVDCTVPARVSLQPFRLHLRPDAAAFFSTGPITAVGDSADSVVLPLRAILMLQREERAASLVELHRLTAIESFRALLPHAYCLSLEDLERKRRMVENYFDLAERVPVFRAVIAAGLEKIAEVAAAIDEQLPHCT